MLITGGGSAVAGGNQASAGFRVLQTTTVSNGTLNASTRSIVTSQSVVVHQDGVVLVETTVPNTGARQGLLVVPGGFTNIQGASGPFSPLQVRNTNGTSSRAQFDLRGNAAVFAHASNTNPVRWVSLGDVTGTTGDGEIILGTGFRPIFVSDGAADLDLIVEPRLTGAGGLAKSGAGTMALQSVLTNTFSGGTIVSNGTLLVNVTNGSGLGTGSVAVENGGRLGGAGQFSGAVTAKTGSALSPGSLGAGQLSTGPLTMQSGVNLEMDLGAPWVWSDGLPSPNDLLIVTGDLVLNGQVVVNELAGFNTGTYTIARYTGTATDNGLTVSTLSGGKSGLIEVDPLNKLVNLTVSGAGPAVLTSPTHASVTATSAVLGATISSDGGSALTSRGTVWGTAPNPTGNALAEGGASVGLYTHSRTGLPSGTLIYYRGYAVNGSGTAYSDNASFYTLSAEPSAHVGGFAFSGSTTNTIGLTWTPVSGANGYLIVRRVGATPTGAPADGVGYSVGNALGDGFVAAIVTSGSSNAVVVTGLSPGDTHHFTIFPYGYNGSNAETYNYKTDGSVPTTSGSTLPAAPSSAASGIRFPTVGSYTMTITWTNGNGSQRLVLMRAASAVNDLPANGSAYAASNVFGTGAQIGSGNFVVYSGVGSNVTVSGLAIDTVYHVAVIEFNGTGASASYKTDAYPTASQITMGLPIHFTLTGTGVVGSDFPAHPADMVVTGAIPTFHYGTFEQTLNMAGYNITSPGPSNRFAMNIGWLTYATNLSGGGILFNSATGPTPSVSIVATSSVRLAGITNFSSAAIGTDAAPVGNVTLTAPGGVYIAGGINARQSSDQSGGGTVTVVAVSGPVQLGGPILNHGRGGAVFVTGTAVTVGNVITYSAGTLRADPVRLIATAGGVTAGQITNWANDGFGEVTLQASGGSITVGGIDTRVTAGITRNLDLSGGAVTLHASAGVTVGVITTSVGRAMTTRLDYGGNVSIRAGLNARATGGIRTFINSTFTSGTVASAGGDITMVSTNGDVMIEGPIDAGSPSHFFSGQYWSGDLTLRASNGWIYLHSLNVDKVGEITMHAATGKGVLVYGEIAGLDTDILDSDIDRFASVRGHVYYDAASNAYLGGLTYPIVNSVGGSFTLTPIPFAAVPTTAATALAFSGISTNQMTLTWVNGNGEGRVVVMREGAAPALPSDGSVYTPNSVFGSGSLIAPASYVVHRGTGNTVTVTGLQPDTSYHVAVFEYNGLSSFTTYKTDVYASGNRPTLSDSRITLTGASHAVTFNGIGEKLPLGTRIYLGATASDLGTQQPFDPAHKEWADASGAFKNHASTNGLTSGSSAAAQEASAHRALAVRQTTAYGDPGASIVFVLTNTVGYQDIQVSANLLTLAAHTRTTTWRLEYRVGDSGAFTLLNTYADPGVWGGTNLTGTLGTDANNQTQPVYVRIVALATSTGSGPARNPLGIARLNLSYNPASATIPTVVAPTVTNIGASTATLGANVTGDGALTIIERGVVWGTSPNPTGNALSDGAPGLGVFSYNRSGLPSGTLIYFRGYADNANGRAYSSQGSFTTLSAEPSTHAGSFTAMPVSVSSIQLNWTPATGAAGYIILMRKNAVPLTQPSDATAYSVGQTLGDATVAALITSGSTTNAVLTGLDEETLYRFAIYPFGYNGFNSATYNYRTDPVIPQTFAQTLSPLYVVRWTFPNQGNFAANALADVPPGSLAMNQTKTIISDGGTDTLRFDRLGASTYSAAAAGWNSGVSSKSWQVNFETTGYGTMLLSSKQRSDSSAPRDFALQVSPDGQAWFHVANVPNLADNWTAGVLSDIALPQALANRTNVIVRWILRSNTSVSGGSVGASAETIIDDILIKGESLSPGSADLAVSVVATPASTFVDTDVSLTITVTNKSATAVSGALLGGSFSTNATIVSASHSALVDGLRAGWTLPTLNSSSAVQRVLVLRSATLNDLVSVFRVFAAQSPVNATTWTITNTVAVNCNPSSEPMVESIANQTVVEGQPLSFTIRGYRTGCTPAGLTLTHSALPTGASVGLQTTNGLFAERVFSWTPGMGTTNTYPIQFSATDGVTTNHRVVLVYVAGVGETLSNGVPVSQIGWSPTILDVERPNVSQARVIWQAASGLTYTVFYSDNLPNVETMTWTAHANVYATNSTVSFAVPSVSEERRYFQVAPVGQTPSERNLWSAQRRPIQPGLQMYSIPLPMQDRTLTGEVGQILSAVLNAAGLFNNADKIHIVEPDASVRTFWLRLVSGDKVWYEDASPVTTYALPAAQGMFIERKVGTTAIPEFIGPVGNFNTKSVDLVEGYNLISLSEGRGLTILNAFNNLASGSPSSYANGDMLLADQVITEASPGVWIIFWRTSAGWVKWSSSGATLDNGYILMPGRAYYYLRRTGQGDMEVKF